MDHGPLLSAVSSNLPSTFYLFTLTISSIFQNFLEILRRNFSKLSRNFTYGLHWKKILGPPLPSPQIFPLTFHLPSPTFPLTFHPTMLSERQGKAFYLHVCWKLSLAYNTVPPRTRIPFDPFIDRSRVCARFLLCVWAEMSHMSHIQRTSKAYRWLRFFWERLLKCLGEKHPSQVQTN